MSARLMTMVLACGLSMPVSMMVVHSSRLCLLLGEFAHHALQFALGHLAVADDDARLGQQLRQLLAHVLDGLDLVVQEVDLAAALELAQQASRIRPFGPAADEGLDRQPFLRRGGDHREVAQAFERQSERARDRRRGQRQHVDLGAQRLQRFLLAHAEAVFLVDDDQAEAREVDVLLQQPVGADEDVDLAFGQALDGLRCFPWRSGSATARRSCTGQSAKRSAKVW